MAIDTPHKRIREREDRSWTFTLLDQVRSDLTPELERDEAFRSLAYLEDYRSIEPLTAMVEDDQLPVRVRGRATETLSGFDDITTAARRRAWWATNDPALMEHALRLAGRSDQGIVVPVATDDTHPLQASALHSMSFGYDEAEFQLVTVRALDHPNADVREAAAKVLLWDEPVIAENGLMAAAREPARNVALAAVDTLQYYRSRQVLLLLSDLTTDGPDEVRAKAAESLDSALGSFKWFATYGDPHQVRSLRNWMAPVADLVAWPKNAQEREEWSPSVRSSRVVVSGKELLGSLADADGEWFSKKDMLRRVDWSAFDPDEREQLATSLATHADSVVRAIAGVPLAEWGRAEELLVLASDPGLSVRKSAMYYLGLVPRDPALGAR